MVKRENYREAGSPDSWRRAGFAEGIALLALAAVGLGVAAVRTGAAWMGALAGLLTALVIAYPIVMTASRRRD